MMLLSRLQKISKLDCNCITQVIMLHNMAAAAIKTKSANWLISAWQALEERPEIAVNGFKKAGIYDAVIEVTKDQ